MGVLALWRYPVKAMLGELLDAVEIGPAGCIGDRRWIVIDVATGERIANKRGPTDPRLRACRAELIDDSDAVLPLRITLPGGETLEGSEIEAALSELLDRHVRLEPALGPARGRFMATGAHHDFAPVHLMTTSTLGYLRRLLPGAQWDVRRFRPNLVLDGGPEPRAFSEDALMGRTLRASSGLRMTIGLPTPRCVVPTRAHEELPADPRILRTIVQEHRVDLGPFGRPGCAGAYAEVDTGGTIRIGDRLELDPATGPTGDDAVAVTVARLVAELASGAS